jgi:hypothetical protein
VWSKGLNSKLLPYILNNHLFQKLKLIGNDRSYHLINTLIILCYIYKLILFDLSFCWLNCSYFQYLQVFGIFFLLLNHW